MLLCTVWLPLSYIASAVLFVLEIYVICKDYIIPYMQPCFPNQNKYDLRWTFEPPFSYFESRSVVMVLIHYECSSLQYTHQYCQHSQYLELRLNVPQLLLGLSSLAVSMAQLDLHLIQVSLHLLLDPQGVVPAAHLRVQGALQGVSHPLAVPLDLLHLLILLCQLPVHLTLDLVQLQLHTKNLGFLMLQSSLNK